MYLGFSPLYMRTNKDVVVFTFVVTGSLFFFSLGSAFFNSDILHLHKVSILSDVFYKDKTPVRDVGSPAYVSHDNVRDSLVIDQKMLDKYLQPKLITNFDANANGSALPKTMSRLHALKQGKKTKVRIAWFGDSMIEGDLLSMEFRKEIQQYFGAYGVGFIPVNSITAKYRTTAKSNSSGNWEEESFKTKDPTAPLYLSGHTFFTNDGELTVEDETVKDTAQVLEKSLLCGPLSNTISLIVNGKQKEYRADKMLNRLLLDSSNRHTIDVTIRDGKLPVYGITMEPGSGVVVDNFSFRGITGVELGKVDTALLQALDAENEYDLVILEYGTNLMFRPNDTDYSWYTKPIDRVVKRMKKAMPNTEFLVISTADRAFLYDGQWQTAIGIHNLVKLQAELAYTNGAAFYNMYENMGGEGTIARWAESSPPLASEDRIHPNRKGAEILGNMLYESFMSDYNKAGHAHP